MYLNVLRRSMKANLYTHTRTHYYSFANKPKLSPWCLQFTVSLEAPSQRKTVGGRWAKCCNVAKKCTLTIKQKRQWEVQLSRCDRWRLCMENVFGALARADSSVSRGRLRWKVGGLEGGTSAPAGWSSDRREEARDRQAYTALEYFL